MDELKNSQKLCAVIGDPVSHSLSPLIHNAGYQALGIQDKFHYEKIHVTPDQLKSFIDRIRTENIRGVSCTLPHKAAVMPFLDETEITAREVGAVNTIVNEDGELYGYNSDMMGILNPLSEKIELVDARIAVLGAGGAARAAAKVLTESEAEVILFNRTLERAEKIAEEFNIKAKPLSELTDLSDFDVIINCSPVGMREDCEHSLVPFDSLHGSQIVFDIVYAPLETKLIRDAKKVGATVIYGVEMLLAQAAVQFKLYTGEEAPTDAMREALYSAINNGL